MGRSTSLVRSKEMPTCEEVLQVDFCPDGSDLIMKIEIEKDAKAST